MEQQRIILSNLILIMIAAQGLSRAFEWISRPPRKLENLSDIYVAMSYVMDIQSFGWLMLIFSITLLSAVFVRGLAPQILMLIGGLGVGIIFIIYSMIASANALLMATTYSASIIGIASIIIGILGGYTLWNNRKKKD